MIGRMGEISVLFISHERKMGGANLSLFELACEMKKKGVKVYVAVLYRGCPIDIRLRSAGIETVPCIFGWWQQPADWNMLYKGAFRILHSIQFFTVKKLCRYIRRKNIGIVHSNSSTIDIGVQAAKITNCKHIYHFREFGYYDYNLEYIFDRRNVETYINNNSSINIFISKALAETYNNITNKVVIYDGIAADCFISNDKKRTDGVVHFLVSGNLISGKNQKIVLEAAAILNQNGFKDKFFVSIAGTSTDLKESQKYEKELKQIKEEKYLENVEFLGYITDMKKLREDVDAEIVPSLCEAYGRVTIEAMAARHIVIVSDGGANTELIEDGVTGLVFEKDNILDLAEKMTYVINNNIECRHMADKAYEYAEKKHVYEKNAQQIYEIYKGILLENEK